MKSLLLVALLTLATGSFLSAQIYRHLTTDDGLPSDHVYRTAQDFRGFIWILTDKGLVKYDGYHMKIFSTRNGLPVNDIWEIRFTPDGRTWYFSKSRALGFIRNDSVFAFPATDTLKVLYPGSINVSGNRVAFHSGKLIFVFQKNKWKIFPKKNHRIISPDSRSLFVFHPRWKQLELNDDTLMVLDKKYHAGKSWIRPGWWTAVRYRGQINDSIYCWLTNRHAVFLNLNRLSLNKIPFPRSVKFPRFTSSNGKIIISGKKYLALWDGKNRLREIVLNPSFDFHNAMMDRKGNIWFSVFNDGVYMLPANMRFVRHRLTGLKTGKLTRISDGLYLNVFNSGFYRYDSVSKNFEPFIRVRDFVFNVVEIPQLKRTFFIADRRLFVRRGKQIISKDNGFRNFRKAVDLQWWRGGLYTFKSYAFARIRPADMKSLKEYPFIGIRDLFVFRDTFLLATSGGVYRFDGKSLHSYLPGFSHPVLTLLEFRGRLLICTDGFGCYMVRNRRPVLLEHTDYLSVQSGFVRGDELFLATSKGVFRFRARDSVPRLRAVYTRFHGLASALVRDVYVTGNDLIATGNKGVSIIPLDKLSPPSQLVDLYWENVRAGGKPLRNGASISYRKGLQLTARVGMIDFSGEKTPKFAYRLLPLQNQWMETGSDRLTFSQLPPGDYRLQIHKENKQTEFRFSITPLWWQRTGTRIGGLLLFSMLVGWSVWLVARRYQRIQTRRLLREKQLTELQLRALRSQMNPHFVFNALAAIQNFIGQNDIKNSNRYLVKFSKLIRRFFEISVLDDIGLDEEIQLLRNYLDIERLRFGRRFSYCIDIEENLDPSALRIPTMLLQPVVENALVHGLFNKEGPGRLCLRFRKAGNRSIVVEIEDDGIGISQNRKQKNKRYRSSHILKNRIYFLNQSGQWDIRFTTREAFPGKLFPGTLARFQITKL